MFIARLKPLLAVLVIAIVGSCGPSVAPSQPTTTAAASAAASPVKGGTLRIGYGADGRTVLALSNSPYASVWGVVPGAPDGAVRRLRGMWRLRFGVDTWYVARAGRTRAVYRTSKGVVREVGIADGRRRTTPRAARRLLRA